MGRKLTVGDKVQCRLYNTPEMKFYGIGFTGTIVSIDENEYTLQPFAIESEAWPFVMQVQRKEILRRVL